MHAGPGQGKTNAGDPGASTWYGIGVGGGVVAGAVVGALVGHVGLAVGLGICFGAAFAAVAIDVARRRRETAVPPAKGR